MPTTYGPWESYTQTNVPEIIHVYSDSNLIGSEILPGPAVLAYLSATLLTDNIILDPNARTCVMTHVIFGSDMTSTWITGAGSCPALTPGITELTGLSGLIGTGIIFDWSGGLTIGDITGKGRISAANAIANTTLSNGMPAWTDPTFPPEDPAPLIGVEGGIVVAYQYQPFTAISATANLSGFGGIVAGKAFEVVGNEVVYGTEQNTWQNGSTGATKWTASIGTDGSYTIGGGPQVISTTQLLEGVAWQFVANCLAPGFFGVTNDPGINTWTIFAVPLMTFAASRTGLRRTIFSGSTTPVPPLQQRQRTDGLGTGGVVVSGKGNHSRQSLMFGRGVF